jgi:hypothetical protein
LSAPSAEKVTDRFFRRFTAHHAELQDAIDGLPGDRERRRYASLLLDRLMVVMFLQREGFVGADRDALRGCLEATRARHGPGAFYREGLLPLFRQGFGGGLFEEHPLESAHAIAVPDQPLARILDFFDTFAWHLDDRPHGEPGAITPDVIGHIFERYINLTSSGQKQGGAYYTKQDVTGYMAGVTLVPRLLERIAARCGIDPLALLREDPARYVPAALADPAPAPGESPIEARDRHAHAERLLRAVAAGAVDRVDGLISMNLDGRRLLADTLDRLDGPAAVAAAWEEVTATRVIDPTCGSGAFLFAALDVLDAVYGALLARARAHGDDPAVASIVAAALHGPNDGYFTRRHAAVSNLFGLDLMDEAIETAKVRLALALASRLAPGAAIPPLPGLDANLRTGNLLTADHGLPAGAFDVVLGNPPFIGRHQVDYAIYGLETAGLPDVYAPCVERALTLLAPEGRFAMVLPIAFQFSARHAAARRVVLAQGSVWVATFSRNPSALFTSSVGVRPIIVATSPTPGPLFTTATHRWPGAARDGLFATLRFSALPARAREALWLPRTGDDEVAELLMALTETGAVLGASIVPESPHAVGSKAFALYYLPVYTTVPPVYDAARARVPPPADKVLHFATREDQLLAFGLLAGELGLLWWMSTGDDFNLAPGTLRSLPVGLAQLAPRRAELVALAAELERALHTDEHLLFTPYARLMTGSWDLRRVREHTRAFDAAVLETLGLDPFREAVLRASARFAKSTGERNGTERGVGWLERPASPRRRPPVPRA